MKFTISREVLLQPISQVVGVVERRQTLPVLANFMLVARGDRLTVTGTDMEVELISSVPPMSNRMVRSLFQPVSFWI